jgi:hypothetical protein
MTVYFDDDVDELRKTKFLCLQLGTGKSVSGTSPKADTGLVLMITSSEKNAYRRVGMFDVSGDRSEWQAVRVMGEVCIV